MQKEKIVETSEEKKLPGILTHRWEDNIKPHLKEIGRKVVDWTDLIQDSVQYLALVNTVTKFSFYKSKRISSLDKKCATT
jgi:hypothetical protein